VWSPFKEGYKNALASIDEICVPLFEWLSILASHAPHSQIVLVGTHLDTPSDSEEPAFFVKGHRKLYYDVAAQVEARVREEAARLDDLLDHEHTMLKIKATETSDLLTRLQDLFNDSIKAHSSTDQQVWKTYSRDATISRQNRLLAQRIVHNLEQLSVMRRRLDVLECKHCGETERMNIQVAAHVNSASGTNVKHLLEKLGAVVGNLSFVKKQVPKRWKAIRHSFPALATAGHRSPVLPKVQAIEALRGLDFALAKMTDSELWDGVMFWAGLGVVLERNEQLSSSSMQFPPTKLPSSSLQEKT
jgi:hypothetical protein